jgi:hypothetical protein
MTLPSEHETWVIEAGHEVLKKMAVAGLAGLVPLERLVYYLWVADYGMRNAGDLDAADDVCPHFQSEARLLAEELSLPAAREAFALPPSVLQKEYDLHFEVICQELKDALRKADIALGAE